MANLTITQVASKYGLTPDTLRYYEKIDLLPLIPRTPGGRRYYPQGVQDWIEMIVCLRHSGVPVDVLQTYAKLLEQGDATLTKRRELLADQLEVLLNKRHNLDRSINCLEHKIALYDSGEIRARKSYFEEYQILDDQKETL